MAQPRCPQSIVFITTHQTLCFLIASCRFHERSPQHLLHWCRLRRRTDYGGLLQADALRIRSSISTKHHRCVERRDLSSSLSMNPAWIVSSADGVVVTSTSRHRLSLRLPVQTWSFYPSTRPPRRRVSVLAKPVIAAGLGPQQAKLRLAPRPNHLCRK